MQKLHFVFMDGTEQVRETGEPSGRFILHKDEIPAGVEHIDVMPGFSPLKPGTRVSC